MRVRGRLLSLGTATLLTVAPSSALASGGTKVYSPPGKAGSSEYSETVPTSGGNVSAPAPTDYTSKPARTTSSLMTRGTGEKGAAAVAKLGSTGAAAAGFAQATAPAVDRSSARTGFSSETGSLSHAGSSSSSGSKAAPPAPTGSALSGVLELVGGSDSGGIGVMLPVLMLFALAAAAVAGVRLRPTRRRGVSDA